MPMENEHTFYLERLSAYVDNELPDAEREQVSDHLRQCAECRLRLEKLQALDKFVAAKSTLDGSDYWETAAQKIEAALPGQSASVKSGDRRWNWQPLALAASVLLVMYVGYRQLDTFGDDPLIPPKQRPAVQQPGAVQQPAARRPATRQAAPAEKTAQDKTDRLLKEAPGDRLDNLEITAPDQTAADDKLIRGERQSEIAAPNYKARISEPTPEPIGAVKIDQSPVSGATQEAEVISRRPRVGIPAPAPAPALSPKQAEPVLSERQIDFAEEVDLIAASPEPKSLDYWRSRRDSLTVHLGSNANNDLAAWEEQISGVQSLSASAPVRGERSMAASSSGSRIEAELTNIWYQICLLTGEEKEKAAGLDFLRQVAADSTSASQTTAARHLSDLGL